MRNVINTVLLLAAFSAVPAAMLAGLLLGEWVRYGTSGQH